MSVNSKMTAVADAIRVLSGTTDAMGLDSMAAHVGNANQTIGEQKTLISTIKETLAGKTAGGVELPKLTDEGAAADLMKGKQLIGSAGNVIKGSFTLENEMTEQNDLIPRIKAALVGKAAGGEELPTQEKTVEITENGTVEILPDDGYVLSKVTANVNVATGGGDDVAGAIVDKTVVEFINDKATSIGDYVFRSCAKLQTVNAPNATSVGQYAFTSCSVLSSVNLPLAESIGQYAFNQCNKLITIVLPSLTTVSTNAFRDCQYVETIDLSNLTSIPANTFYGCRGLKTLILRSPTMVTLASSNAFTTCYRILGTKNAGFNPNGERLGFAYVPRALVEEYQADAVWSSVFEVNQFRAIEDYPDICG